MEPRYEKVFQVFGLPGVLKTPRTIVAAMCLLLIVPAIFFAKVSKTEAAFAFYRTITVDHTKVSTVNNTDLTNFPVLVSGTYPYLATVSNGGKVQSANGYDIGFYAAPDCLTGKLSWETEKYIPSTGEVAYWVKVPSVSHSADTQIYLCYNDASITTDQSSKTSVWDTNYRAIYHLSENPVGTAPQTKDSTINAYNLSTNTTLGTPATTTGQINTAVNLPTTNQYLGTSLDSSSVIGVGGTNTYTISGWVNINNIIAHDGNRTFLFGVGSTTPYTNAVIGLNDTGNFFFEINKGATWGNKTTPLSSAISTGNWYYVVGTNDGNNIKLYVNGSFVGSTGSLNNEIDNQSLHINHVYPNNFSNAKYDEVRASDIARSADWVATEYNNQSSPASFYSVGSESTFSVNVPNAPQSLTGTATSTQASLSWQAPGFDGGSPITNYIIQSKLSASSTFATTATTSPSTLNYSASGLVNGISYDFRVMAQNAIGASDPSNSVTITPIGTPGAPTNVTATAGFSLATVSFTPPVSNGGSPITTYTVTSNPGNISQSGSSSPISITGLTNGTDYTFTVTATNSFGTSTPSAASNTATPQSIVTITSAQSGNWSATSTWVGGVVPGDHNAIVIASNHSVTVDTDSIIGGSGVNGTVAITTNPNSHLIIGAGKKLTVRGDTVLGGTAGIEMKAGSTWEFDSSQAPNPSTIQYNVRPSAHSTILFVDSTNCTAISRCTIKSNSAGGNGYFTMDSFAYGGGLKVYNTDFSRIGDSVKPAIQLFYRQFDSAVPFDVEDSTFDSSGGIDPMFSDPGANATFIYRHVIHTNSVGNGFNLGNFLTAKTGGTREISYSVFDKTFGSIDGCYSAGNMQDVSVHDNYFGDRNCFGGLGITSQFQYNLFRKLMGNFQINGDTLDNYYFIERPDHDHSPDIGIGPAYISVLRNIWDSSFAKFDNLAIHDGLVEDPNDGQRLITLKYNIVLPGADGIGSSALEDIRTEVHSQQDIQHNTLIPNGVGGVMYEYETSATTNLGTLSNNIFWDTTPRYVAFNGAFHYPPNVATDPFSPSQIQNNNRFNIASTVPACTGCTNQGNGYASAWSVTPGASDLTVDPQFLDKTRNLATFDTAYLGHVASTTWSSAASSTVFQLGDIVSDQNPDYFANAVINYRALATHAKGTLNSRPGVGTDWHNYWEMASLNTIRNSIANGSTITDPALGLNNATYIVALEKWVQRGFSPTNQALKGAATDGGDIGAMPVLTLGQDSIPPVISNIVATSATSTTAITWATNEPSDSLVEYGVSAVYSSSSTLNSSLVTSHLVNLSGLTTNTLYHYRVLSKDAAGNLATSTDQTFSTSSLPPTITSFVASPSTIIAGQSSVLFWSVTGANTVSINNGVTFPNGATSTPVSPLSTTIYTLTAVNGGGTTTAQTTVTVNPDTTAPTAPTGLVATAASSTQINLTWQASTDNISVTGYKVFRSQGAQSFAQIATTTILSYSNQNLTASTTYNYKVAAFDAAGNTSALSATSTATTLPPPDVTPPVISNIQKTGITATTTTISWTTNEAATTFVDYGLTTSYGQTAGTTTLVTSHSIKLTSLTPNTTYNFKVRSQDAAGNTASSTNQTFTTLPIDTPPAAVSDLAVTGVANRTISLRWTAPGADGMVGTASSYDIRRSTSPITESNWASATQVSGEPVPQVAGTTQTYTATGLNRNTRYYFGVKTTDSTGNTSLLSNVVSGVTN